VLTRDDLDEALREKRAACGAYRYDAQSKGIWKNYGKRTGWDEIVPVPPRPGTPDDGRVEID
jgi:hypothetical protein